LNAIIDLISIGVGELGEKAKHQLAGATLVIGSKRQLSLSQQYFPQAEQINLPSPLSDLTEVLQQHATKKVAILASGDGLFFGIGSFLLRELGRERLQFYPNISSIQSCMGLIGEPWQDAVILSLHGRAGSLLRRHLSPNTLFGIFTDQDNHPGSIAQELVSQGLGGATVWVGEALGSESQKLSAFKANTLAASSQTFHPLNVVVVKTTSTASSLPTFPGIPDHQFSTAGEPGFGMISKREVRLTILSFMQPAPEQIAWDIGAGCGSVCVEWARWNPRGKIYGVESNAERITHIQNNASTFGVESNCIVVHGTAPSDCENLPDPDCIFIGGSNGNLQQLLKYCYGRLRRHGALVASAVTKESQDIIAQFSSDKRLLNQHIEWSEVSVRKNLPDSEEIRTLAPVHIVRCVKS